MSGMGFSVSIPQDCLAFGTNAPECVLPRATHRKMSRLSFQHFQIITSPYVNDIFYKKSKIAEMMASSFLVSSKSVNLKQGMFYRYIRLYNTVKT